MGQTCLDGKVFIEGHEERRWIQHNGEQALKGLMQSFAEYLYLCNICRTDAMWSGNAICSKFQGISAKDIGEGEKLCDRAGAYDEWNGKWSYWENQLCKRMMGMNSTPIVGSKDHSTPCGDKVCLYWRLLDSLVTEWRLWMIMKEHARKQCVKISESMTTARVSMTVMWTVRVDDRLFSEQGTNSCWKKEISGSLGSRWSMG